VTSFDLIEQSDRWILPVSGQRVSRCCVGYAVTLMCDNGLDIDIEGAFAYRMTDGREHLLDPQGPALDLAPVLSTRSLIIREGTAFKDGRLQILFENGSQISVPADPSYEPWTIATLGGINGLKVVSIPGGDLAIWPALADPAE
jgi:hypothetical protein